MAHHAGTSGEGQGSIEQFLLHIIRQLLVPAYLLEQLDVSCRELHSRTAESHTAVGASQKLEDQILRLVTRLDYWLRVCNPTILHWRAEEGVSNINIDIVFYLFLSRPLTASKNVLENILFRFSFDTFSYSKLDCAS